MEMPYIIRLYKTVSILSAKIIMIMGLFVGWGLVIEGNACAQGQPLLYTVPFKAGDSGYLIFRIPAIWAAPNKPLMAFAEGRVSKRKAMGNIDIVLRRSLDLGQTWEPLQVVADFGDDFCGNPCVVQDPMNSRLWLSFTRSSGAATEEQIVERKNDPTTVWITYSDDDGSTWSKPLDLSSTCRKSTWGWYGTGPGLGLFVGTVQKGRLIIPAYHTDGGVYRTHCLLSDDHGATWRLSDIAAENTSEPQVVVMPDQSLVMNARTIAGKGEQRTLVVSRDRGQTWKPVKDFNLLLDNHCQGCMYRSYRSGTMDEYDLIFTQPASRNRVGVTAWLSADEGKTWPFAQTLWRGPSAYTAMIRTHDGQICNLIECGKKDPYEQIAFVKYSQEWLRIRKAP
ncbi:MAG: exo-alpha-sialidase [Gemmataceae bacterium]|nr:exo-alpha-sialidase [Gemmataceae bacterium]